MQRLNTDPNVAHPDDVYDLLIKANDGLTSQESLKFSARLILLLINHIGDEAVVREAIAAASRSDSEEVSGPAD